MNMNDTRKSVAPQIPGQGGQNPNQKPFGQPTQVPGQDKSKIGQNPNQKGTTQGMPGMNK